MIFRGISLFTLLVAVMTLVGCKPNPERREIQFMPDMYFNQARKAQSEEPFFLTGSINLMPPAGTIPRGFTPYPYKVTEGELAGKELVNPLATKEVLAMGQKYYNINCIVCHGPVGAGDGLATKAVRENGMPIPPQLYSEKIRKQWGDGQIYHTITLGQAQMPAYGYRITPEHRWAIVHYVRALGLAATPTEAEVKEVEKQGLTPAKESDSPFKDPNYVQGKYNTPFPESVVKPQDAQDN